MGSHIIKMFGRTDLGRVLSFQFRAILFHQFDKAVQLRRNKEGIDRITEENQICPSQALLPLRRIFLQSSDKLPDMYDLEFMHRKMLLNIQNGIEGYTVLS